MVTAAASLGPAATFMPASSTGCWIFSRSVSFVRIFSAHGQLRHVKGVGWAYGEMPWLRLYYYFALGRASLGNIRKGSAENAKARKEVRRRSAAESKGICRASFATSRVPRHLSDVTALAPNGPHCHESLGKSNHNRRASAFLYHCRGSSWHHSFGVRCCHRHFDLGFENIFSSMSFVCTSRHRVSPLGLLKAFRVCAEETSRRRIFTNGRGISTAREPIRKATTPGCVATTLRSSCQDYNAKRPNPSSIRFKHQSVRMKHRAFVALGSNLGDRVAMIEQACNHMDQTGTIRVLRTSSLWETKAMYVLDQDKFVNGVCEVDNRP